MKKTTVVLCCIFLVMGFSTYVMAQVCTTIQDGINYLPGRYLEGQPIPLGFDPYGYNYQAHMFSGFYANVYLNGDGLPPYGGDDVSYYQRLVNEGFAEDLDKAADLMNPKWYWPYRSTDLLMKWNDAWLSNKDCEPDGKLDRHYGFPSYIGSGAWETNHMKDVYMNNGKPCKMVDFVKIVAVPMDAYYIDLNSNEKPDDYSEYWYTSDAKEIGASIWGEFAIIEEIYNDPCEGFHGKLYVSPDHAGFGGW